MSAGKVVNIHPSHFVYPFYQIKNVVTHVFYLCCTFAFISINIVGVEK